MNLTSMNNWRCAHLAAAVLAALALAACGGGSSTGSTNGSSNSISAGTGNTGKNVQILASTTMARSNECKAGAVRLDAGIDTNGNGVLDANEITSTQYVCNGVDGTDGINGINGTNGSNALVKILSEPAGANCANGGSKIIAGLDGNGNGILDAAEVTSTGYVCNGAAGPAGAAGAGKLMNIVAEPAGVNCPNGGSKVTTGPDSNGNGMLDAAEVTSTAYLCNGHNGAAGSNGKNSLLSVVNEAAGVNCANGGSKITSGLDANGNGMLDADEVTSTAYICNGAAGTAGANGSNGSNGINTLMASSNEAAGANCTYGGSKITSGPDTNGNGILDAGEVTATSYVCNGVGLNWVRVTGTAVQAQANMGYLAANDSSQVVVTLPASLNTGDVVRVSGAGAGGWKIAQNAGQSIITRNLGVMAGANWTARESNRYWSSVASSADGSKLVAVDSGGQIHTSIASTTPGVTGTLSGGQYDAIELQYLGNGMFSVLSSEGSLSAQ